MLRRGFDVLVSGFENPIYGNKFINNGYVGDIAIVVLLSILFSFYHLLPSRCSRSSCSSWRILCSSRSMSLWSLAMRRFTCSNCSRS